MRELAYNWEIDSYVTPDMTILSPEITGDGIVQSAYQQIPDSILWCVRSDGKIATFTYERKENITAWARQITDGDFESVAIISGDAEDEIWVSVERTIDSNTVRYIEKFQPRDFGDDEDAFFVDCGATYTTDVNEINDLTWLEGENVFVLADHNEIKADDVNLFSVSNSTVTLGGVYTDVQIGLPYTVKLRTMPLSWIADGFTIQGRIKRINGIITRWKNSGDFYFYSGDESYSTKQLQSISGFTTAQSANLMTMPAGFDQYGYTTFYQYSPEPLTILAVCIEFMSF
jgi:hypothetical protein